MAGGIGQRGSRELLAALAGMVRPTKGEILINGKDVRSAGAIDAKDMRDLGMAHVPEDRLHDGLVRTSPPMRTVSSVITTTLPTTDGS